MHSESKCGICAHSIAKTDSLPQAVTVPRSSCPTTRSVQSTAIWLLGHCAEGMRLVCVAAAPVSPTK